MKIFAIIFSLIAFQVIIPVFAEDEIGYDVQQPTSEQAHPQRASNSEAIGLSSKTTADQAPKIGHIGKDQTQSFRFATGSRF